MLIEIYSEILKEKTIKFNDGLNVVLGDAVGSNSIGKSTLLMVLDFVFGGKTYLEHNADTIKELGHHNYNIVFEFEGKKHYFSRDTENKKIVYKCDALFQRIKELPIDDYTKQLKKLYNISCEEVSFRSTVSLFSRIWGKENLIIDRPLHNYSNEKNYLTILTLIKIFNKYSELTELEHRNAILKKSKDTLNSAGKFDYIPMITKSKYNSNQKDIISLEQEINKYRKELEKMTINLSELVTDEIVNLNSKKDRLVNEKGALKSRLNRIDFNSEKKTKMSKKKFEKLIEFFPDVNIEKLNQIEDFHGGITKILSGEIKNARKSIEDNIEQLDSEIIMINHELEGMINVEKQPKHLIEKLIRLDSLNKQLSIENNFYDEKVRLTDDSKFVAAKIVEEKMKVLINIEKILNIKIASLNNMIHKESRMSPSIKLNASNYLYNISENTGTGKAYTNLILFDLAVFELTELPVLIHDSLLFKQIEVTTVDNIIEHYASYNKQVFISIDETTKYDKVTQDILNDKCIQLLSNEKLLFTKDWRSKS